MVMAPEEVASDALEQEDASFEAWYRDHHARLRTLCQRLLRDRGMAEDVAQETLLRAWTRRDEIRPEEVGVWLSVVAKRICISILRREGRVVALDPEFEQADHDADPALAVIRMESSRSVRDALAEVEERQRNVLYLHEVGGVEYDELGATFGVTAEGARSMAFRARSTMRRHLRAVGEGFSGVFIGIRVRVRGAQLRVREALHTSEAFGQSLQAGLSVALATSLALAGGFGDGTTTTDRLAIDAAPAVVLSKTVSGLGGSSSRQPNGPAAAASANTRDSGSGSGIGPVHPAISPHGPYPSIGGDTDLPGTNQDPWFRVWFEDDGKPSPVTNTTLAVVDMGWTAACEQAPQQCEEIDDRLGATE